MAYHRVIPRDLFNEANLLKCYGQLALNLDHLPQPNELVHDDDAAPFHVEQDPTDGSITITNVRLMVRGVNVPLWRPLNARRPYPLWADTGEGAAIEVFHNDGSFTEEMIGFLTREG